MKRLRTLALLCVAGFAAHTALPVPAAVTESPETIPTALTKASTTAKAQQSTPAQQSAPAQTATQEQRKTAGQSLTQVWEHTPRNQLTHLLQRDYRTAVIPYQKTQELREASKILVDPTPLLRPPPPFEVEVSPDEPLQDVLTRIMPEIRRLVRPQTPFVIVLKRNSIERFILRNTSEGASPTAEDVKNIRISPGDVIVLDIVGY